MIRAFLGLALALTACAPPGDLRGSQDEAYEDPAIYQIAQVLEGTFSSARQARADSAYFDIRLRTIPIWPSRADGPWLYVEQAAAEAQDRPYRQRVYRIRQAGPGRYASEVYTLPGDPLGFAGAWQEAQPLGGLTPDSLTLRTGCTVFLQQTAPGVYAGGTEGTDCPSGLRGAAYATSAVTLRLERITSWDRGFDADGRQVWGAVAGPYVFDRIED